MQRQPPDGSAPVEATEIDVSEALALHLKFYPGKNEAEFEEFYGETDAPQARALVRPILDEAMKLQPDGNRMSLNEAGDYVEAEMSSRYP